MEAWASYLVSLGCARAATFHAVATFFRVFPLGRDAGMLGASACHRA